MSLEQRLRAIEKRTGGALPMVVVNVAPGVDELRQPLRAGGHRVLRVWWDEETAGRADAE